MSGDAVDALVRHLASLRCWSVPVEDTASPYQCGSCWPCSARIAIGLDEREQEEHNADPR